MRLNPASVTVPRWIETRGHDGVSAVSPSRERRNIFLGTLITHVFIILGGNRAEKGGKRGAVWTWTAQRYPFNGAPPWTMIDRRWASRRHRKGGAVYGRGRGAHLVATRRVPNNVRCL